MNPYVDIDDVYLDVVEEDDAVLVDIDDRIVEKNNECQIKFDHNPKHMFNILDFEIIREIGSGKWGLIFLAKEKKSNFIVALKIIRKRQMIKENMENQVNEEIANQSSLAHPNILRLFGHFDDTENIYLILEYASNGSLYDGKNFNTTFL